MPSKSLFLAVALGVLATSAWSQVQTEQYFPFHIGDRWVLASSDTTIFVRIPRQRVVDGLTTYEEVMRDADGQAFLTRCWTQDAAGTHWVALEAQGTLLVLSPPVTIPPQVSAGDSIPFSGSLLANGSPIGTYRGRLQVTSTSATVETPAGTFTSCLHTHVTFHLEVGPNVLDGRYEAANAPQVGLVSLIPYDNQGQPAGEFKLLYAQVGGSSWGHAPITTSVYFPLAQGDRWTMRVFEHGDVSTSQLTTLAEADFHGQTAYPIHETSDSATSAVHWFRNANNLYVAGLSEQGEPDTWFEPAAKIMPSKFYIAQVVSTSGTAHIDDQDAPYQVTTKLLQADLTITVPAGTFTNCILLEITVSIDAGAHSTNMMLHWWLARNVGLIKSVEYEPGTSQVLTQDWQQAKYSELVWALVGGIEYGTQPQPGRPGDIDGDGYVTAADARAMLRCHLGGAPEYDPACDLYPYTGTVPDITPAPDGVVDARDIFTFIRIWRALSGSGDG